MSSMVLRTSATVTPDPALALQHSKAVPAESAPEAQAKNHRSPLAGDRTLRMYGGARIQFYRFAICLAWPMCAETQHKLKTRKNRLTARPRID